MVPPMSGWTYEQVRELDLPFDWELVDGAVVPRGRTPLWHNHVRSELYAVLREARREPYAVAEEQCFLADEYNPSRPDVVVFDRRGLDLYDVECLPAASVVMAVEVVSPGSRAADRVRKPVLYAEAGVEYFWRVERGDRSVPVVHEFWLPSGSSVYIPSPDRPVHEGKLIVTRPFPVELDLSALIAL